MTVLHGDCLNVMPTLEANSVDAIVCDPPYALTANKKGGSGVASIDTATPYGRARIGVGNGAGGFMGMKWDAELPTTEMWREALRVAKPGAHLVAFGGSRTYHRLACAIEDAGWEIRDCLSWLYGSGFPKSKNVSLSIDKGEGHPNRGRAIPTASRYQNATEEHLTSNPVGEYEAKTDLARQWHGWGTALKPAWEPIILARKPLVGTVAANVAQYGTGGLNVDGCRIGTDGDKLVRPSITRFDNTAYGKGLGAGTQTEPAGRWPANVVLDEDAAAMLDAQTGERKSGVPGVRRKAHDTSAMSGRLAMTGEQETGYGDTGGASRFFYTAKASRRERNAGLDDMPDVPSYMVENGSKTAAAANGVRYERHTVHKNGHPTVKPIALMRWLCRLVTPPNGLILDPFTGSGSTGCAAVLEGFRFVGIEREAEYVEIAEKRIAYWATQRETQEPDLFTEASR